MCIYSQNTIKKHLHIFHNRLYSIQSINRTVIVRHSKHNATIQKLNIIENTHNYSKASIFALNCFRIFVKVSSISILYFSNKSLTD